MRLIYVFAVSCVLVIAGFAYLVLAAENRPPFVHNVHAEQRAGTKLVDVTYDVDDPDSGATFNVPARTFASDVASGTVPGKENRIARNAGGDMPDVFGMKCRAMIPASDGKASPPTIIARDGAHMALIPAGEFMMGDSFGEGYSDELPVHKVILDSFYMDVYEVTNAQYAQFLSEYGKEVDAAGHGLIRLDIFSQIEKSGDVYRPKAGYEDHPVVMVTWYGAAAYAQFYGKRLPTEAEWEKAARGGLVGERYPWGDDITHDDANYSGTGGRDVWDGTSPVGMFSPNGYGLFDMAGNVWEWCADEKGGDYYSVSPMIDPKGPGLSITFTNDDFASVETVRVLRGGPWAGPPNDLRVARRGRLDPVLTNYDFGFRCVSRDWVVPPQDGTSTMIGVETMHKVSKNESFPAAINVENISNLTGFQFDIAFDPTVLEAVTVEEGTFLSANGGTYWLEPDIDNEAGMITGIACAITTSGGVDGSGTLATVTFKAVSVGESDIKLQNVMLSDPSGEIIPATSTDTSVIVVDYPLWDVNKDGVVNVIDMVLVGEHFGESVSAPQYPNPDVNGDAVVNIQDIVLVGQHFGEVYTAAAPSQDIWSVGPQYLPILAKIYAIMEAEPSADPDFITTKSLIFRLMANAGIIKTEAFQNYPNPFNPDTWIPYQLAEDSEVTVRIYDSAGRLIRTLDLGHRAVGLYITRDAAAYWDGKTDAGEHVSSGVFFYNIQAGEYTTTKKMIMAR